MIRRFSVLSILLSLPTLGAVETIQDAAGYSSGGRSATAALELVAEMPGLAGFSDHVFAGGFVGQVGNQAPVLNPIPVLRVRASSPGRVPFVATDADGDRTLLLLLVPPAHGTVSFVGSDIVYEPHTDFTGQDIFTLSVDDGADHSTPVQVTVRRRTRRVTMQVEPASEGTVVQEKNSGVAFPLPLHSRLVFSGLNPLDPAAFEFLVTTVN